MWTEIYPGMRTKANVTDEVTGKLDDIVHKTKAKKGIGVRYMKSIGKIRTWQDWNNSA